MAHKHVPIAFKFKLDGREYEAVGFLEKGEREIEVQEALRRTADENNGPIGREDMEFIIAHFDELPFKFDRFFLYTGCYGPDPGETTGVAYFFLENRVWHREWTLPYMVECDKWTRVLRRVS